MSKSFDDASSTSIPPAPPPMQIHCTSLKLTPTPDGQWRSGPVTYNGVSGRTENRSRLTSTQSLNGNVNRGGGPSTLIASVNGEAIGAGPCRMYASLPRKSSTGHPTSKTNDPQVNKLVYNMYRELLNTKHARASNIVNSAPQDMVKTDEGVANRVVSMMRQQTELKGAKMETAGPPPPPPPPPFQTAVESAKPLPPPAAVEPSPMVAMRAMHKGPPAALAGAMMKDKKPFTYTPGGIDLSEIKSPRMQRRLQKNAACEGVRPSPLAQQQPPSPTTPGAVPPLPPQGMVQVLPVPGMAMAAPVKKPQPKEPPKPKRNVCGPPPPPPPFSISSSSADPSPSPTPYDSPSSTPAMNSTTSPSTPADVVAPVFPATPPSTLPSASSSSTPATPVEHSTSSLQPVMASEPGPSVPLPPPLPPTARKLEVRKDLSSSTEAEESVASPPSITSSDSNESERPQINAAPKGLTTQLNEVIEELKQKSASPVPAVQEEPTHETQPEETAKSQEEEKDAEPEKKKTSRPVTPKSHESRWGLKDGEPSQALPVEDPAPNQLPDRTSPVVRRSEDSRQSPSISASKRHSNQLEYSLRQDPHIRDALKEQGKSERTTQDSQNKVQPLVQPTLASPLCNDRPAPREDSTTQEKEAGQRNRPWMRMPSPPVNTSQKQTKQPKDRLVRQASLPAQPVSPQATLPTAVAGSLYIPPVEQSQDGGVGSSATPSSGGRGDTSSPLDKGPLPWMRAHRKEASPPPEFMVQAQKTQERLQRQRSKAEESRKQQLEKNSPQVQRPQLNQISYQSLPSYTEPQTDTVIPPPDIFKDQIPVSQPAWRGAPGNAPKSDHYRDSPTYQAHQQVQQQQQQLPAQQNPFFQEYQPNQEYQQYPNQSPLTQLQRPRERIIPIMLEGTPPTTPVKQNPEFYNPGPHQQLPGRQASWPTAPHSPYSAPPYPMNVPVQEARASSNALEALQQMQQNLAQLNTGLQTGSKDMHRELCKTLAERISQKSAQPPNKQNGGAYSVPVQMAPTPSAPMNPGGPPMQSRSFKVIQNVISNQDPANMSDACEPEPRKYTGSNIPSRSFKMLQAMTDNENESCPTGSSSGPNKEEVTCQPLTSNPTPTHSNRVSPTRSYTSSPTIHYLNSNNCNTSHNSDTSESSNTRSFVSPSYTTTRDSPVYRHVSPKVTLNGAKSEDRVVSKALINRKDDSPTTWEKHGEDTERSSSPFSSATRASSSGPETRNSSSNGTMNSSARLLKFVQENQRADPSSESSEPNLLYGGDKIPSRVFRQLQQEYPSNPRNETTHTNIPGNSSPSEWTAKDDSIPALVNRLYISNGDNHNTFGGNLNDDALSETKASVMKELTSQFDPKTHFKRPRAAPGRVFKYLQETYDLPPDATTNGINSESESNSSNKSTASTGMSISSIDDGHYDVEPKPYGGCRLPGRTFKMLQDNIETHPSVFQARK